MDYQYINKMTDTQYKKEELINLEQSLQNLKDRYASEAVFSDNVLKQQQLIAVSNHPNQGTFSFYYPVDLGSILYTKTLEGWSFTAGINQIQIYPNSAGFVSLSKPKDILDSELSNLRLKVSTDYLQEIETNKSELTSQIVELTVQIADLKKRIADESKKEATYAKVLKQVEKDLAAQLTVVSEGESETVLTKPNKNFDAQGTAIDNNGEVISNE